MTLDYIYGQSGELFAYFRIPKALFQDSRFRQLSTDARTLYGILLDRMSLSAKNGWLDEQGRVYIIYTVREVQESLCCAEHKAVKLFRELEQANLIERKRRGLGRPSLIYVKNFSSGLPKAQVQNCANSNSCAAENAVQVQPKPQSNKTDKNKTERNNPFLPDESDREQLEDYFYQALEVELLLRLCPDDEDTIFKKQYKLTTWVEVQIRYKTVWIISPAGIPVPTQMPYEYKIFHTKLENRGLEVVIREELTEDQWKRCEIFQDTRGGRPYLFNGGLPPGGSDGSGAPGIDYTVPAEALTDTEFADIYEEAKKYVGTPYVWGGSTPETGFDCSGYVCWVYNQAGYDVGRTTANGLWQKSQHISEAEAKPGDLVFFKGTYDTPGMSHVGIYLGNGKMVSAGDPIKYADIHSSYWQQYLAGFGRLSK